MVGLDRVSQGECLAADDLEVVPAVERDGSFVRLIRSEPDQVVAVGAGMVQAGPHQVIRHSAPMPGAIDIDALQFLLNADAEETKRFPHYAHVYAAAIIRIDPGSAPEFLMSRIEAKQKAQGQYIYFAEPLFALLQKLPASNLEELEKRGAKWRDPWKARLDEALAVIRHNAATE